MAEVSFSNLYSDRSFNYSNFPVMSQYSSHVNPNATLTPTLQKLTKKKMDSGFQPSAPVATSIKDIKGNSKPFSVPITSATAAVGAPLKQKKPVKFSIVNASKEVDFDETSTATNQKLLNWKSASADSPSIIDEVDMEMQSLGLSPKKKTHNIEQELSQQNLYKTELCRSFEELGACRYGPKCQFAHGRSELRPVLRHPKYKTEICKTWQTTGTCPYGTRCRFIHAKPGSAEFNSIVAMSLHLMALHKQQAEARLSEMSSGDTFSEAPSNPLSPLDPLNTPPEEANSSEDHNLQNVESKEHDCSIDGNFDMELPIEETPTKEGAVVSNNKGRPKLSIFAQLVQE